MASYSESIRSGLPRVPGGEPWPPAGTVAGAPATAQGPGAPASATAPAAAPAATAPAATAPAATAPAAAPVDTARADTAPADTAPADTARADTARADTAPADTAPADTARVDTVATAQGAPAEAAPPARSAVPLRRGLPRVAGGEPWPAEGFAPVAAAAPAHPASPGPGDAAAAVPAAAAASTASPSMPSAPAAEEAHEASRMGDPADAAAPVVFGTTPLRRGLPRVPGGEPWPAEGFAPAAAPMTQEPAAAPRPTPAPAPATESASEALPAASPAAPAAEPAAPAVSAREAAPAAHAPTPASASQTPAAQTPAAQTPAAQTPASAAPAAAPAKPAREPRMIGSRTLAQWAKLGSLGLAGLIVLAAVIVLAARGLTTLPGVPEFVERYPGEYEPAVHPDEGFPAWARWTHYLNLFFMVLIVRSGLTVRHQQKPDAFFTPKRGGKKVSIHLWLHTSIDVLWIANGIIFVVLLFATGHWARIVPTSWEVFPNALSAMLQYLTLEWPLENGWVNYNALQQLMYFIVVFIAAPVAAITGLRMSEWWPKDSAKLDRVFPAQLARALHYPTMLFFVIFVIIHVFLVLTTGALRNLNHMFAGNDGTGWLGFWMFVAGLVVIAVVWVLTRPLVIAPIANLFGKVSNR